MPVLIRAMDLMSVSYRLDPYGRLSFERAPRALRLASRTATLPYNVPPTGALTWQPRGRDGIPENRVTQPKLELDSWR